MACHSLPTRVAALKRLGESDAVAMAPAEWVPGATVDTTLGGVDGLGSAAAKQKVSKYTGPSQGLGFVLLALPFGS